ncbi:hypothetical protein BD410DRAFT_902597 [Rickenella mellea]|uniref:Uncharacterized protein n=1 Tax=Rickenella mellea TaxID=50990 RepID=A0A4Y7PLS5_9AGAM|nr:hypothetical protein BD410DRAFT_902597 [Rickenella mellea]
MSQLTTATPAAPAAVHAVTSSSLRSDLLRRPRPPLPHHLLALVSGARNHDGLNGKKTESPALLRPRKPGTAYFDADKLNFACEKPEVNDESDVWDAMDKDSG